MKEKLQKPVGIMKMIFGYGIMITLFAGGLTFFGYLIALFIGGESAEALCTFIYKQIIPVIIYATTILVLFGLLTMYLAGDKALVPHGKKDKKEMSEEHGGEH